ncbi:hypothetical protein C9374_003917 [Naegleria lovaniensis]|uniref:Sfi1 spindle body domain-containing protein n=1 Tax=Naegleria lovaniensis TaxID=51637 RepID=A0AA88H443_NAELO|nr:uncharacterized protein C9374_003917 [Naegleria lovaniensis]KAG2394153.1 hypothetical protein C9374_003917 [Naegleria lovaniensis]
MTFSSYSSCYKEKKRLSHPTLIKWIKEERKNQLPPPKPKTKNSLGDEDDDLCRKCFPNGIVPDDKENVQEIKEELNDSKRVRFSKNSSEESSQQQNLNNLTNSTLINNKLDLHKKVIFMHHPKNEKSDDMKDLSDEHLFGKVHSLLSSIKSNRVEQHSKITNMRSSTDFEEQPRNCLRVSPSSLFLDGLPIQTPNFSTNSLPSITSTEHSTNVTLSEASRQIQSMYNQITSIYGSEPLRQRQIIFEKPIQAIENVECDTLTTLHYLKEKQKSLRITRLQEIRYNIELERSEMIKNQKVQDLKRRIHDLRKKISLEREKDALFRKQRLKEINRLRTTVKNSTRANEKAKMFITALNVNQDNYRYQVAIYEGEIATCLAKLFFYYLKMDYLTSQYRQELITKMHDEVYEGLARNSLLGLRTFAKKSIDLRRRFEKFTSYVRTGKKAEVIHQWRLKTKNCIEDKKKEEIALTHYYNGLQKRAFNSLVYVITKQLFKQCGNDLAHMWKDRITLGKAFHGWRHLAEKTKYLKHGLLKFAVADSFDDLDRFKTENELESYRSYNIRLNFRTKITKNLIQLYREKKQLLTEFEYRPKLIYVDRNPAKLIDLSTIYKIEKSEDHTHSFYRQYHAYKKEQEDCERSLDVKAFEKTSIPDLTQKVCELRLKKKALQHWRVIFFEKVLDRRAEKFHKDVLLRKAFYSLAYHKEDAHEKISTIREMSNANLLVSFFSRWKEATNRIICEKDCIAEEYHNITIVRKVFNSMKQSCLPDYNTDLIERLVAWRMKEKERILKKWKLMLLVKKSKEKFEQAVSDQYNLSLLHKLMVHWKQRTKKQQLLRKAFTAAVERMRAKTRVFENKKLLAKYVFKSLKRHKDTQKERKKQLNMFMLAKKTYDSSLKQKVFILWRLKYNIELEKREIAENEEEQIKGALASEHYRKVMTRKILTSWKEYTIETKFVDIILQRKAFNQWRRFTLESKERSIEEPRMFLRKIMFRRWKLATIEHKETRSLNALADRFHHRNLCKKGMQSLKEFIIHRRIEHVQLIRSKQYYIDTLRRKVIISLLMNINEKKEKRRKKDKADLFYHKKLIQSNLNAPLSLDRFLKLPPDSPLNVSSTLNIVYYKILFKAIDSWKIFVNIEKEKRLRLARAVHAHSSNLKFKFFDLWRRKSKLASHKLGSKVSIHSWRESTPLSSLSSLNWQPLSVENIATTAAASPIVCNTDRESTNIPNTLASKVFIHHHHYLIASDSDSDDVMEYLTMADP